jgi:hypothetical protein
MLESRLYFIYNAVHGSSYNVFSVKIFVYEYSPKSLWLKWKVCWKHQTDLHFQASAEQCIYFTKSSYVSLCDNVQMCK